MNPRITSTFCGWCFIKTSTQNINFNSICGSDKLMLISLNHQFKSIKMCCFSQNVHQTHCETTSKLCCCFTKCSSNKLWNTKPTSQAKLNDTKNVPKKHQWYQESAKEAKLICLSHKLWNTKPTSQANLYQPQMTNQQIVNQLTKDSKTCATNVPQFTTNRSKKQEWWANELSWVSDDFKQPKYFTC